MSAGSGKPDKPDGMFSSNVDSFHVLHTVSVVIHCCVDVSPSNEQSLKITIKISDKKDFDPSPSQDEVRWRDLYTVAHLIH